MISLRVLSLSIALAATSFARTYHFDASAPDDHDTGLEPSAAWKSLARFNATIFEPGDIILFRAGQQWEGQLRPQGSGTATSGITVGRYGEGASPEISGNGDVPETLLIQDVHHWTITGLAISNKGPATAPDRSGIRIQAAAPGAMSGITLRGLHVHDVNGDLRKSHEGHGILFDANPRSGAFFDGMLIEQCHLERADRNGICQRGKGKVRSRNVIIRANVLDDIGGDGIKLWGTNGGLIEKNLVRNSRARCTDHAAGIWPFACDDTIIQFNEVSGTKGILDGQGFDADYLCRRTVIQYNYSHDNEGGFILICSPGNHYNEDTVIRHNVSYNDGVNTARVIQIGGNPSNTRFEGNTVILTSRQDLPLLSFNEWDGGHARGTRFTNNRFIVAGGGRATYVLGKSRDNRFEDNWFIGRHEGLPAGVEVIPAP